MDELQIPYPDFQLGEIIDPEQHDLNNRYIQTKINEFVTFANTLTGSAGGASTITVAPIAPFTSTNVQAVLNDLIARIQATQVEISGSSLVGTPALVKLAGTTVEAQLKALDNLLQQAYVITTSIADGAVITVKLADGAVTDVKLADNSVITSKIIDNAVTQAKIAMSAVTTPKIADGAVTTIKIANNAVTQTQIAPNAVGTPEIINTSVITQKLADGAVTTAKLANKAVTVDKIDDSLLTYLPQSTLTNRLLALEGLTGLNPVSKEQVLQTGSTSITTPVKSPVNVKRIVGKTIINHIPLFDSGVWSSQIGSSFTTIVNPNKIIAELNGTESFRQVLFVNVKPNTDYTLSYEGVGEIGIYTIGTDYIRDYSTVKSFTFNSGNNSTLRIFIRSTALSQTGTYTFENLSLVEGTQPKPFVANVKGLTNPTIVNETNGTSLVVPTTLYDGEYVEQTERGELLKYKKWQELTLDSSLNWAFRELKTGYKYVQAPLSYNGSLTVVGVKFDGTIMYHGGSINDNTLYSGVAGYIVMPIKNSDSGWGPNYSPTPEEVKAFITGWTMYHAESGNYNTPYNGTGTKAWVSTAYKTGMPGVENNNTTTLPTTKPNTAQIGAWQPYRLIYEIASTFETIEPYGDLTLEKGDNSVKVYAGRIVNEGITPKVIGGNARIGDRIDSSTLLKHTFSSILRVYQNSNPDTRWIADTGTTNLQGPYRLIIPSSIFDQTASYTVDYEPLYTWEVTTPIDSVLLQYFETLQAVTNELVHDVAKQQDTMKRMLENVVNEDEGIQWITPTLLNGWVNFDSGLNTTVAYFKDSLGYVHIKGTIKGGATHLGTIMFTLPRGYRPTQTSNYSTANGTTLGTVSIGQNGNVVFATGNNTSLFLDGIPSFKAEQ